MKPSSFFSQVLLLLLFCFSAVGVNASESHQLRLALLPIPDVLPFYVAQEKGYFEEEGVKVKALPVGSPVERDQLMQAGSIDGMINEISSAAAFNRQDDQVRIVAIARAPQNTSPLFRILASPKSAINKPEDLAGVAIGVSKNTIIEYITTRMLAEAGIGGEDLRFASVPVLPERFQLLLSGQIAAATLPDPLGAAAIKAGAREIVNDLSTAELSASVITFSLAALEEKRAAVGGFMRAWDRAAADLNAAPEEHREIMLKKIRVPKMVREDFIIPPMSRSSLPTREQWEDVMAWMLEKELLDSPVSYEQTVTDEFLPK
jgi:NitT/TauT family transport system substrate-binding protein